MTTRDIAKRLLHIHGVLSLVFLLLISWSVWTGILSVYADLARPWLRADVAAGYKAPVATPSEVLSFVNGRSDPGPRWNLVAPTPMRPFYVYAGPTPGSGKPVVLMVNPRTGLDDQWNNFALDGLFRRLHTDLLLPKPWGRLAMGLAGAFIAVLVGTGLFIHGKQLREAWLWRRRSRILDLSESHKRIGLWLTPFLLLMALTGAILGMKIATVPIAQLMASGKAAARDARPPRSAQATTWQIDACVARAARALPGTRFAGVEREGDRLDIRLLQLDSLQWSGEGGGSVAARCDLRTGTMAVTQSRPAGGMWGTIESALRPIHYARFGGIEVLVIYIVLSILCLWVIDSGMKLLWHRKKDVSETIAERLYHGNNRLYVVLPLILLYGNLLFGTTLWVIMAVAVAGIVAASLMRYDRLFRSRIAMAGAASGYAALVPIQLWLSRGGTAAIGPVLTTNLTLILFAGWLVWLPYRQRE